MTIINFTWLVNGLRERYPLCCVIAFVVSNDRTYGRRHYEMHVRNGLTPLWAGTGYVPCERCKSEWVVRRMD